MPMRTMNSTYAAFADPLVWASWLPPVLGGAAGYELYEDAGEGREYEDPANTAHATTEATLEVRARRAGVGSHNQLNSTQTILNI